MLQEAKELVLTKSNPSILNRVLILVYNGLVMTTYCPPLNRLFFIPRNETLLAIINNFAPEY